MQLSPVDPDAPLPLGDVDAIVDGAPRGKRLKQKLNKRLGRLAELQNTLYADGRYALLVILQGRDASGKDGTIRRVFSACNQQGCMVTSFSPPTELELRHDFLWRVHQVVPAHRMVGVFNRSHYEDVLAARVHESVSRQVWQQRYEQINDFERMLVRNNVVVLKFFLHVSRGEQYRRLLKRVQHPAKNWKFEPSDLDDWMLWDAYTEAAHDMLRHCSTPHAPWYLVPADDKRVRDYLVAGAVVRALRQLDLRYPACDPAVIEQAIQAFTA